MYGVWRIPSPEFLCQLISLTLRKCPHTNKTRDVESFVTIVSLQIVNELSLVVR